MGREHMREDPPDGQGASSGRTLRMGREHMREDPLYGQGAL